MLSFLKKIALFLCGGGVGKEWENLVNTTNEHFEENIQQNPLEELGKDTNQKYEGNS